MPTAAPGRFRSFTWVAGEFQCSWAVTNPFNRNKTGNSVERCFGTPIFCVQRELGCFHQTGVHLLIGPDKSTYYHLRRPTITYVDSELKLFATIEHFSEYCLIHLVKYYRR